MGPGGQKKIRQFLAGPDGRYWTRTSDPYDVNVGLGRLVPANFAYLGRFSLRLRRLFRCFRRLSPLSETHSGQSAVGACRVRVLMIHLRTMGVVVSVVGASWLPNCLPGYEIRAVRVATDGAPLPGRSLLPC